MATKERTYTAEELEQALRPLIDRLREFCAEIEERLPIEAEEEL